MRAFFAEFIGTFFLCFCGIAAILSDSLGSGAGLVGIALAHGLALSIAINVFGGVSGAHLNPAVTIGLLSTCRICPMKAVGYIISQLAGATFAAFICASIFPEATVTGTALGTPLPSLDWVTNNTILLTEGVMTFLLMTAVFGTAVDERGKAVKIGAFGIGLMVTADILAGGKITGASMNPARSFGPAMMMSLRGSADAFKFHWCYWAGPVAGALIAALIYHHVLLADSGSCKTECKKEEAK